MKSFKSTAWILLPQPVLIIGTYDKNGKPNVAVENIVQTQLSEVL